MYQAAAAAAAAGTTVVVKHKHGRHLDSGEWWIILNVSNKSLAEYFGVISEGKKEIDLEIYWSLHVDRF